MSPHSCSSIPRSSCELDPALCVIWIIVSWVLLGLFSFQQSSLSVSLAKLKNSRTLRFVIINKWYIYISLLDLVDLLLDIQLLGYVSTLSPFPGCLRFAAYFQRLAPLYNLQTLDPRHFKNFVWRNVAGRFSPPLPSGWTCLRVGNISRLSPCIALLSSGPLC